MPPTGMTIEWPRFASPVHGLGLRFSRRRFGQNSTAIHEAMAPIWIHAESGRPSTTRSGEPSATLVAVVEAGRDAACDVGGSAGDGGAGATLTVLLTETPPRGAGSATQRDPR